MPAPWEWSGLCQPPAPCSATQDQAGEGFWAILRSFKVPSSSHPAMAVRSWGSTVQAAMPAGHIPPPHPSQVASRALLWDWGAARSPDPTACSALSLYEDREEPQHEWLCFCPKIPILAGLPALASLGALAAAELGCSRTEGLTTALLRSKLVAVLSSQGIWRW